MGNTLGVEPQMYSTVLTDSSHTCGSLDLYSLLYSLFIGDTY